MNILETLNNLKDEKYKEFHQKICTTKYEIMGVKIPILRKLASDLLKTDKFENISKNLDNKYYECIMLEGILIGKVKKSLEEKIELINIFLPKIDNWAICDIFCSELKIIKNNQKETISYIENLLKSKEEYYLRVGIVLLLDYYINDEYIDYVLETMLKIKSDYYYVKMAISWTLSICLVKYFDKTLEFLKDNKYNFDKWTYNKALQKARESFRITNENKKILKNQKI